MSKISDKYYLGLDKKYNFQNKNENIKTDFIYVLNRCLQMFKYHNLPSTIPQKELETQLLCGGYTGIVKIGENLYSNYCGLGGENDIYDKPTMAIYTIPKVIFNAENVNGDSFDKQLEIDKETVIIDNDSSRIGLSPLIYKYCNLLIETNITLYMSLINKRVQTIISATDDRTKESAEQFLKKLIDGDLSVISENQMWSSLKLSPNATSKDGDGINDIYELYKSVKADLFRELGLASYDDTKKERITQAELELNTDTLYPLVDDMLDSRRKGLEKVNAMFGTDIEVELNSSWDYRAFNGKSIHDKDLDAPKDDEEINEDEVPEKEEVEDKPSEEKEEKPTEEEKSEESEDKKDDE